MSKPAVDAAARAVMQPGLMAKANQLLGNTLGSLIKGGAVVGIPTLGVMGYRALNPAPPTPEHLPAHPLLPALRALETPVVYEHI